jgi:urate oxidase
MVRLGANQYGKAEVRLVRIARGAGPEGCDLIRDFNVSSSLSGDLADSHLTEYDTTTKRAAFDERRVVTSTTISPAPHN